MSQFSGSSQAAIDYNSTIIGALELSEKKWVLAVQLPGVRAISERTESTGFPRALGPRGHSSFAGMMQLDRSLL